LLEHSLSRLLAFEFIVGRVIGATARTGVLVTVSLAAVLVAGAAGAAKPVSGFINGPIVSVGSKGFVVSTTQVPGGTAQVSFAKSAPITARLTVKASDLRKGLCVNAVGSRAKNGTVTAMRIDVSSPVKGQCARGFRGGAGTGPGGGPARGGNRPAGAPPRGSRSGNGQNPFAPGNASFGFAFGKITTVKGKKLTVDNQFGSPAKVTVLVAKRTEITKMAEVGASAVKPKLCAVVYGTSSDLGKTVEPTSINLSPAGANGCTFGFPGRGGRAPGGNQSGGGTTNG